MIKTLAVLGLAVAAALPAQAGPNVSVSIGINAPGQYGRINIDNYPQPVVYHQTPVVIAPTRVADYQRPIYLYVPTAHQRDWGRYCGGYRACGQPVYFVQESWVRDEYRREHEHGKHKADKRKDKYERNGQKGHGKGHSKGHGKHGD